MLGTFLCVDLYYSPKQRGKWAAHLGISSAAIDLYLDSEIVDMHIDSWIWKRVFGYDILKRHRCGMFRYRFYSQSDVPRLARAHVGAAIWVITTNPFRTKRSRHHTFFHQLKEMKKGV